MLVSTVLSLIGHLAEALCYSGTTACRSLAHLYILVGTVMFGGFLCVLRPLVILSDDDDDGDRWWPGARGRGKWAEDGKRA